jgi:hypothetical protein
MIYRDLFIDVYQDDGVECLEFDDENFGCGKPLGYKMQVLIDREGVMLMTSQTDPETGEVVWLPDSTRYKSLDAAAQVIIARYLQHYKNSPDSITEEMGLTTMQEWMHEFAGETVMLD